MDHSPETETVAERIAPAAFADSAAATAPPVDRLAVRESRLWRLTLVILIALAMGLAVVSWKQLEMPWAVNVLPVGLVVLVLLFGAHAWTKSRELAELRGLVRGLEQRAQAQPDNGQVEKLFDLVQRSQQGYRDLIDTFDDLLFSVTTDGRILAANRSLARLLGQPFSGLVGRSLFDFADLTDGTGRAAAARSIATLEELHQWSGVLRVKLNHDSSVRFLQCTAHTLEREGQSRAICVLARDVTKERESETRFTELFETLQEGVYVTGPEGRFESVNPAFARMLGYEKREVVLDRTLTDFLAHPEEWEAQRRELALSGAISAHEIVLRCQDGSYVTCLHAAVVVRDAGGCVRRQQGTLVDITERREMERRLHREQEFARRLVEGFPDLVIAVDREFRYTFVSPQSKDLLGYAPEELIGRSAEDRMDTHDRKEVRELFESIFANHLTTGNVEYLTQRKDGAFRLFRASASALRDSHGNIEGVIASTRDITEPKRMEQQLIQTERLAAMGQMIAGVAHELNNPLTAVLGVTELLRDTTTDDNARRQLEIAHRQAHRAAQIVQSLLTFSRPPQPRKTCLHLSDLIQRSLQLHEHSLRANHITVDFLPKPELPSVLGDASQLTQVFLNLIANAEQAICEVRDHGNLRIRVGALGDNVLATFQDDGVGIRREILSKLFDPFFTTKRPGRGTGLGLSICLAILREHNGRIEAQSLSDGGSVFTVSLPMATGTATFLTESLPAAVSVQAAGTVKEGLDGCRVLIVDDEESIRELVRDGLSARSISVDVAASAEEALELAKSHPYDAILCDLNLRGENGAGMGGRELHDKIVELSGGSDGKPLFLFMTGEFVDNARDSELGVPRARILQKPFRISQLVTILTEAIVGARSDRAQSKT